MGWTDSSGSTALCIAAQHGCPGVVATLLAAEANVWHAKANRAAAIEFCPPPHKKDFFKFPLWTVKLFGRILVLISNFLYFEVG